MTPDELLAKVDGVLHEWESTKATHHLTGLIPVGNMILKEAKDEQTSVQHGANSSATTEGDSDE